MSNIYNFDLTCGSSTILRLNVTNEDGSYINLSGYQTRGQIRSSYSSPTVLLNLPVTVDTSYVSGIINLNITGQTITGLKVGQHPFDIEVYATGSNGIETYTTKFLRGICSVYPEITR